MRKTSNKTYTYKEIVEHFVKIIGNGTFVVETINESILIKMLESKGIKISLSSREKGRDVEEDYKRWLKD